MPKKLKVYQTSQGFFDLAVAAPSMKAALEAWGTSRNLFHQGFAKESVRHRGHCCDDGKAWSSSAAPGWVE
jgi:hypothetical protein